MSNSPARGRFLAVDSATHPADKGIAEAIAPIAIPPFTALLIKLLLE
jgi:hypothetical protein